MASDDICIIQYSEPSIKVDKLNISEKNYVAMGVDPEKVSYYVPVVFINDFMIPQTNITNFYLDYSSFVPQVMVEFVDITNNMLSTNIPKPGSYIKVLIGGGYGDEKYYKPIRQDFIITNITKTNKRLAIPYTIIALITLLYLLLPPIGILTGAVGYRRNYIRFVGDAVFHLLTNEIIYGNGTCNKLGLNEFAILRMLVQSPVVSIEEIKSAIWPDSTVKAQGKSFNVAFSSLCNILKEVDEITIERGAEEIILTDSTTKGVRRWQHFRAMIDILRKRV